MAEKPGRPATIFDVARLAGVSHQTVSRVLNDLPNVRASTKQRVELAIKQLRYVPSPAARALVTRRTRTIGAIATGGPDYGPSSTMLGFNEAARAQRYAVSMANVVESDLASVREAVELLLRQNVEALVLITERVGVLDAVLRIETGIPLVAVDPTGRAEHAVAIDQYQGARIAVEHLLSLGHRKILHLAGPLDSVDAGERARGWRDVMAASGLAAVEPLVGDWSPDSGFRAGETLSAADFSAVFVANDQMALGLMHSLRAHGRRVPDEVSLVGFDDIPEAAHLAPPLTTLRQDFATLGRQIMDSLAELLSGEAGDERAPIIPQLVVRASTGVPTVNRVSV
ncbi:LacI family DNA-binding transcriptional regulator [Humibacter albus]|uniref:LacI family DNA-binding transcriptional regulator n=1 Tax=Humibacter albus TaxID=427754 RepID=UPI00041BDD39|nr:LacI family DNA-binding transcriptional regulator [Humibacter albus]